MTSQKPGSSPDDPFGEVSENLSNLGTQLGDFFSRERVKAQAGMQKFFLTLATLVLFLGLLTLLMLLGWILIFYATTEVLAQALGGRVWLSALILGGVLLLLAFLSGLALWMRTARKLKRARLGAAQAKDSLRESLLRTENSAKKIASISVWTRQYPLQVTGVAMLAGFSLAGPLTSPSPSPQKKASTAPKGSPVFDRMQVWATLINTGADILKDVLTPLLQDMVRPTRKS